MAGFCFMMAGLLATFFGSMLLFNDPKYILYGILSYGIILITGLGVFSLFERR